MKLTINKTKEAVKLIFQGENQAITPLILGSPGLGKSEIIQQIRKEDEYNRLIDIRLSQHDNTDIKGVPSVQGNHLVWVSPEFMPVEGNDIYEGTTGILFFDEINRARQDVLQSVFEIVYDRRIGGKKILDGWKIVCAGNLGYEDGCNVTEMDKALLNRFVVINVDTPSIKEWTDWAKKNNIRKEVISFLKVNPHFLYVGGECALETTDENDSNSRGQDKAFITPRSWEKFSKLLTENEGKEDKVISLLGWGIIYEATPLFLEHFNKVKKIEAKEVVKNYSNVKEALMELERAEQFEIVEKLITYIKDKYNEEKEKLNIPKKDMKNIASFIEEILDNDTALIFLRSHVTTNSDGVSEISMGMHKFSCEMYEYLSEEKNKILNELFQKSLEENNEGEGTEE